MGGDNRILNPPACVIRYIVWYYRCAGAYKSAVSMISWCLGFSCRRREGGGVVGYMLYAISWLGVGRRVLCCDTNSWVISYLYHII